MFSLSAFIKNGLIAAVGRMADYQVILNAAGWFEKQVLTETDLVEIQQKIEEKNARIEAERTEEQPATDTENVTETEAEIEITDNPESTE